MVGFFLLSEGKMIMFIFVLHGLHISIEKMIIIIFQFVI